jgi:hypothetical protein
MHTRGKLPMVCHSLAVPCWNPRACAGPLNVVDEWFYRIKLHLCRRYCGHDQGEGFSFQWQSVDSVSIFGARKVILADRARLFNPGEERSGLHDTLKHHTQHVEVVEVGR